MNIIIPIGISGSGKDYLYDRYIKCDSSLLISTDNLRYQLSGDVNNQDINYRVFAYRNKLLAEAILGGEAEYIYCSSTNLSLKAIEEILGVIKYTIGIKPELDISIRFVLLEDSRNVELCTSRVAKDIENGVNRSRTHDVVVTDKHNKEETSLLKSMSCRYMVLVLQDLHHIKELLKQMHKAPFNCSGSIISCYEGDIGDPNLPAWLPKKNN